MTHAQPPQAIQPPKDVKVSMLELETAGRGLECERINYKKDLR